MYGSPLTLSQYGQTLRACSIYARRALDDATHERVTATDTVFRRLLGQQAWQGFEGVQRNGVEQ
jgi:hypothetical protein